MNATALVIVAALAVLVAGFYGWCYLQALGECERRGRALKDSRGDG